MKKEKRAHLAKMFDTCLEVRFIDMCHGPICRRGKDHVVYYSTGASMCIRTQSIPPRIFDECKCANPSKSIIPTSSFEPSSEEFFAAVERNGRLHFFSDNFDALYILSRNSPPPHLTPSSPSHRGRRTVPSPRASLCFPPSSASPPPSSRSSSRPISHSPPSRPRNRTVPIVVPPPCVPLSTTTSGGSP